MIQKTITTDWNRGKRFLSDRLKTYLIISQKWNTYGKLPASGPGSTIAAARNFMNGLDNIVNFVKETLNKEKISILGKTLI